MPRIQLLLLASCLIAISVGCRSRCNNPCGGGWFAGGSTIAPASTYSLNIPSVAANQPYYTPNAANPNAANPNPNAVAPTASNGQPGWRPTNGTGQPNDQGNSVLAPTTFVESSTQNPAVRTASNAPLPGTGLSFTQSPNYQTTRADERQDATRLPVTDASAVRAPAQNLPTGNLAGMNPNQQGNYPAGYNAPVQQTYVAQNGYYPSNPVYSGSTMLMGGQTANNGPTAYRGPAVMINPNGYPTQALMAESSATFTPNATDWRSRELNSDQLRR